MRNKMPGEEWKVDEIYDAIRSQNARCSKLERSYPDAVEFAERYNERVAMSFGEMNVYYCFLHSTWHVGHRGKRAAVLRTLNGRLDIGDERTGKEGHV